MPELPEVETTRRGISPYVIGETVKDVHIRERRLRWPISTQLGHLLKNRTIQKLKRRAKYLLFYTENGCLIVHLGMSGSLRIIDRDRGEMTGKYDHVDIVFDSNRILRFRDPRKFGSILWSRHDPSTHQLIRHLGPEPLSRTFDADHLYTLSRKRIQAIKTLIMDNRIVSGVGNIYANESLFVAGIHPGRKAGRLSKKSCEKLTIAVKIVLNRAIKRGGTTLRDFTNGKGNPGYFQHELHVYGRAGKPCKACARPIRVIRLGQRSSFYCATCQQH